VVFFVAAENYALRGMFAEALSAAEKAYQLAPWHPRLVGLLAGILSRTGDQNRADDLIRQLTSRPDQHGVPMGMILYHLVRGDEEGAIDWFEKGIEQREPIVVVYHGHPRTKAWRSNPRWVALMRKMNLPDAGL
jgi:Flp pilus assembly protein TadD